MTKTKTIYQDDYKRGAVWPKRSGHAWQYACVETLTTQVGVTEALEPIPPQGRGWYYVSCSIAGNSILHFWKRRL